MKKRSVLESVVEKKFSLLAANFGCKEIKIYKKGWPDRMIMLGEGYVFFIEFKRLGRKPDRLQKQVHKILKNDGYKVYVCDNYEDAKDILIDELHI